MALKTYYARDVHQTLLAVAVAALAAAAAHGGTNAEYVRGVLDVTRAAGLAYGYAWPELRARLAVELAAAGRPDVLAAAIL